MQSETGKSNLFERCSRNNELCAYCENCACFAGVRSGHYCCTLCRLLSRHEGVRAQWVSLHLVRVRGSLIQPCKQYISNMPREQS